LNTEFRETGNKYFARKSFYQKTVGYPIKDFAVFTGKTLPKECGVYYIRPELDFCYGEFTSG
jgi:hypothetical protein